MPHAASAISTLPPRSKTPPVYLSGSRVFIVTQILREIRENALTHEEGYALVDEAFRRFEEEPLSTPSRTRGTKASGKGVIPPKIAPGASSSARLGARQETAKTVFDMRIDGRRLGDIRVGELPDIVTKLSGDTRFMALLLRNVPEGTDPRTRLGQVKGFSPAAINKWRREADK